MLSRLQLINNIIFVYLCLQCTCCYIYCILSFCQQYDPYDYDYHTGEYQIVRYYHICDA